MLSKLGDHIVRKTLCW